jgi:hypothetical protein
MHVYGYPTPTPDALPLSQRHAFLPRSSWAEIGRNITIAQRVTHIFRDKTVLMD